jgi:hydroxymethylpyrimidine pyrophosphatase-like HAD family hydrolase
MYKVIATDLDGTLLNGDHQLDPFTVATVRRLEAEGLHFIIATGTTVTWRAFATCWVSGRT